MQVLKQAHAYWPVLIVAHRSPPNGDKYFPSVETPNVGLEFGAYDFFLKNHWDKESSVLFMHDDVEASFEAFAAIEDACFHFDQAFIFADEEEEKRNYSMSYGGGVHGRGVYCSSRFLQWFDKELCECHEAKGYRDRHNPQYLLSGTGPHGGFWFDPNNSSHTWGPPPEGVRDYNTATIHFAMRASEAKRQGMKALERVYISEFRAAKRGKW